MRRSFCAVAIALVVALVSFGRTASSAETIDTVVNPQWTVSASPASTPVVIGRTIVIATESGIAAIDGDSGKRIWNASGCTDPAAAGETIYANRPTVPPSPDGATLVALDIRDGHQRWAQPRNGGILAADGYGIVVGNERGVTRFNRDGRALWTIPTPGGYKRIVVNEHYVVALSVRSGAILHGEIESIERRSGRLIGTQVWFGWGDLLALGSHNALGESDYPGDFDTWCGDAELLDVSLNERNSANNDSLAEGRSDFVLEDIALSTPPPNATAYESSSPCKDRRSGHPAIVLDVDHVILASGPILGIFDRTKPAAPFAIYRDATFVGGPFAGRLYVARPHGLDALTIGDRHSPRFDRLLADDALKFTVAGLADRLYASDGATTTAFNARTFSTAAVYRMGCAQLTALVRTVTDDVVACDRGPAGTVVAALRR